MRTENMIAIFFIPFVTLILFWVFIFGPGTSVVIDKPYLENFKECETSLDSCKVQLDKQICPECECKETGGYWILFVAGGLFYLTGFWFFAKWHNRYGEDSKKKGGNKK